VCIATLVIQLPEKVRGARADDYQQTIAAP
jgi:hypothetical protein